MMYLHRRRLSGLYGWRSARRDRATKQATEGWKVRVWHPRRTMHSRANQWQPGGRSVLRRWTAAHAGGQWWHLAGAAIQAVVNGRQLGKIACDGDALLARMHTRGNTVPWVSRGRCTLPCPMMAQHEFRMVQLV